MCTSRWPHAGIRITLAFSLLLMFIPHTRETEAAAAARYEIIALDADWGSAWYFGAAVGPNAAGQIAGTRFYAPGGGTGAISAHGFFYSDRASYATNLTYPFGLNDAGQAVGIGHDWSTGNELGVIYDFNTNTWTVLGTLGGSLTHPYAINNAGLTGGGSLLANGDMHAFLYDAGGMRDLGTLGGATSQVRGLNDVGQATGLAETASRESHAFLFSAGTMQDLGTLGGSASVAYDLNDLGQVVGEAWTLAGQPRGFLYDAGIMQDLGTLGGSRSVARAINNLGQVVGSAEAADGQSRAFLYADGGMHDLNDLIPLGTGWTLIDATGINDMGQILTVAQKVEPEAFRRHPLLLTPLLAVDAGGPYPVAEGGTVTLTVSSEAAGPLTYAWDLDQDGVFESPGQSVLFSAAGLDGPGRQTVTVRATDSNGFSATDQANVEVRNVPPAVSAGPDATLIQGNPYVGAGTFTDPGPDSWTATVDYGDGTSSRPLALAGSGFALAYAYASAGTFTVIVTVSDDDDGTGSDMLQVTVLSPEQGVEGIIGRVRELVAAGELRAGPATALIAKLEAALRQLERGNTATAINQLEAFVNQVSALIAGGTLAPQLGQPLIDLATEVIAALRGP